PGFREARRRNGRPRRPRRNHGTVQRPVQPVAEPARAVPDRADDALSHGFQGATWLGTKRIKFFGSFFQKRTSLSASFLKKRSKKLLSVFLPAFFGLVSPSARQQRHHDLDGDQRQDGDLQQLGPA